MPATERNFRNLTPPEISLLEERGCRAERWEDVAVENPFLPDRYRDVEFIGKVRLGSARGSAELPNGISRMAGISRALVADCEIGRDVYINNVYGGLRNLVIGDNAVIDSVYTIACRKSCCFGNDIKIKVLSESGGREVAASTQLTAQIAYLMAFYRHSALLQKRLGEMAADVAESRRRTTARIGAGTVIVNCGEIYDTEILGRSEINGAAKLSNGTIVNASVGTAVFAEDFIILDGASVDSAARLHRCFVGQGAAVASGFTAADTLLFANARLENGESEALFAGPFTNSLHKSSLLIGGYFSFFNAGSGSNQSNHSYRLGPIHQGITGRGCKTGSDSYILWPAAIAPFTTIVGRHYSHPDTRCFPFSLLTADAQGRSLLIPAVNIGSVGLARDVEKWPVRDNRDVAEPLDIINFSWLSPYTVGPMLCGMDILAEAEPGKDLEISGAVIPAKSIEKALYKYNLLLDIFIGTTLRRMLSTIISTNPEITAQEIAASIPLPTEDYPEGLPRWADMAGMLCSREQVDSLIQAVAGGEVGSFKELTERIEGVADRYFASVNNWLGLLLQKHGLADGAITPSTIASLLNRTIDAVTKLEEMYTNDAAREYEPQKASLSFGIDADDEAEILDDFHRVRGSIAGHPFLARLHQKISAFKFSLQNLAAALASAGE